MGDFSMITSFTCPWTLDQAICIAGENKEAQAPAAGGRREPEVGDKVASLPVNS